MEAISDALKIREEFPKLQMLGAVPDAVDTGYKMVMFTDEKLNFEQQVKKVATVVSKAHGKNVVVEGELVSLQGIGRELNEMSDDLKFTTPESAANFVGQTGVDSLARNIGQAYMHGKTEINLNLDTLAEIKKKVKISLVLHGGSNPHEIVGSGFKNDINTQARIAM